MVPVGQVGIVAKFTVGGCKDRMSAFVGATPEEAEAALRKQAKAMGWKDATVFKVIDMRIPLTE